MTTQQVSEDECSKQIRTEYVDVFSGLGRLARPYHMEVDPMADPVIHPPHKVPHPLRDKLAETLEDMVKQGVLQKVDGPSEWVNSMVVVQKKDGSLRTCIDLKDLNRALKREHYQFPTIEEITARMPGARYFSTLDARSADTPRRRQIVIGRYPSTKKVPNSQLSTRHLEVFPRKYFRPGSISQTST
jgi:hypothetical protein